MRLPFWSGIIERLKSNPGDIGLRKIAAKLAFDGKFCLIGEAYGFRGPHEVGTPTKTQDEIYENFNGYLFGIDKRGEELAGGHIDFATIDAYLARARRIRPKFK